jgi:hypothetical protein
MSDQSACNAPEEPTPDQPTPDSDTDDTTPDELTPDGDAGDAASDHDTAPSDTTDCQDAVGARALSDELRARTAQQLRDAMQKEKERQARIIAVGKPSSPPPSAPSAPKPSYDVLCKRVALLEAALQEKDVIISRLEHQLAAVNAMPPHPAPLVVDPPVVVSPAPTSTRTSAPVAGPPASPSSAIPDAPLAVAPPVPVAPAPALTVSDASDALLAMATPAIVPMERTASVGSQAVVPSRKLTTSKSLFKSLISTPAVAVAPVAPMPTTVTATATLISTMGVVAARSGPSGSSSTLSDSSIQLTAAPPAAFIPSASGAGSVAAAAPTASLEVPAVIHFLTASVGSEAEVTNPARLFANPDQADVDGDSDARPAALPRPLIPKLSLPSGDEQSYAFPRMLSAHSTTSSLSSVTTVTTVVTAVPDTPAAALELFFQYTNDPRHRYRFVLPVQGAILFYCFSHFLTTV